MQPSSIAGRPRRSRRRHVFDRRLFMVVWPLLVVVVLLVAIDMARADILSSVRAYVGGESLWSKAQKDAVHHLVHFSESRQPADLQAFATAIRIPLGDRRARIELEKAEPDLDVVRQGFGEGGIDADDIPGMVRLFSLHARLEPLRQIVAIWAEGDAQVDQLVDEAAQLETASARVPPDEEGIATALARIRATDLQLTPIEQRFSSAFGVASRSVQKSTNAFLLAAALLLLGAGVLITRRMLRSGDAVQAALRRSQRRHARAVATEADAQHALRSLQELLTAAPAAFVAWSTRGGVLLWSDAAERLFGIARDAVLGKPLPWALAPVTHLARELPLDRHRTTSVVGLALELVDANGRATPSSTSLSRLPSQTTGADTFAAVIEELTPARLRERRRIDSIRAESDARLKQVHQRIGNQLMGFAALLQPGPHGGDAQASPDAVAGHLLTIATLHELKSRRADAKLDLQALVERGLAVASTLHGRSVVWSRSGATLDGVLLDEELCLPIAMAFDQMLANAVQHRADPKMPGVVDVELRRDGSRATIDVANNGTLPGDFDFALGRGLGAGLGLVRSMLAGHALTLRVRATGGQVLARLELACAPVEQDASREGRTPASA